MWADEIQFLSQHPTKILDLAGQQLCSQQSCPTAQPFASVNHNRVWNVKVADNCRLAAQALAGFRGAQPGRPPAAVTVAGGGPPFHGSPPPSPPYHAAGGPVHPPYLPPAHLFNVGVNHIARNGDLPPPPPGSIVAS